MVDSLKLLKLFLNQVAKPDLIKPFILSVVPSFRLISGTYLTRHIHRFMQDAHDPNLVIGLL